MLAKRSRAFLVFPMITMLFLALIPASPAIPATPPSEAGLPVRVVEERWEVAPGITVPVAVYFPDTGGEARYPLLVMVHPWGCDRTFWDRMAREFAAYGYVCATYTVRGWDGSDGQITVMAPENEIRDLSTIITLVGEDPRFPVLRDERGPITGVTGYSMGGCHAYLIAPRENPMEGDPGDTRVRAVVPLHGGADLVFSMFPYRTTKLLIGLMLVATAYIGRLSGFLLNTVSLLQRADKSPWDKFYGVIDGLWRALPLISSVDDMMPWMAGASLERRTSDMVKVREYMNRRSIRYWCDPDMDDRADHPVTAPMMILTGWNDDIFYANEGLRVFSRLIKEGVPKRIFVTNHGHMGGMVSNPILDIPENEEQNWLRGEIRRWFDRFLKGVDNGVDREPALVYYAGDVPGDFRTANSYPLPGTRKVKLYLSKAPDWSGRLERRAPAGWGTFPDLLVNTGVTGSISLTYLKDAGALFGSPGEMDIPVRFRLLDIPFAQQYYLSDPLPRDMVIMGTPGIELYFQSQQAFCQLVPFLYEVTPGGEEVLVSRGWFEGQDLAPWGISSTGGELEMQAVYHRFRKGSRIKLELATADLLSLWPYWGLNIILVHHSSDRPSSITLPVVSLN
jgi:putative CocE/NonD family hydrolase